MNFSNTLIYWYLQTKRDLPWRKTRDPYLVWLSEIILQQTRVSQGMSYYLTFSTVFPTVEDLANAEESKVLKMWQGLGYYSRARNLHYTAKYISNKLCGQFPTSYKELIHINIKHNEGYFEFFIPKDRVASSSARIFALWITIPALLMITIAILFLKNQTRPIINLAKAAERFGKGENIDEYRPSGALEIRQAGLEFDKMRKRIMRHLNQRSEMLSGISHDLRTPLTRLKLQLSFMKDKDLSKKMSLDIDEMEKMLNEYLQFTSSSYLEKDETFDISELIETTINKYNNDKITKEIIPRVYMNGRKNLIQRSLNNLIDNSIKYAENINFHLSKKDSNIIITIDDDGVGIPKEEFENVFKPFYKVDKSRGDSKSSVGLGLSITSDIIKSHGGNILLDKSPLNGLRVKIFLPL